MEKEIAPDPFLNAEFTGGPNKTITAQFKGDVEAARAIIDMLLKIPGVVGADWDYA